MAALLHPDTLPLFSFDSHAGLEAEVSSEAELSFDAELSFEAEQSFEANAVLFASFEAGQSPAARSVGAAPWNEPGLRLISGGLDSASPINRRVRTAPATARSVVHTAARPANGRVMRAVPAGLALAVLFAFAAVGALTLLGADAAATVPASPAAINHPTGVDATTTSSAPVEVVVQSGDTLWTIARRLHPTGEIRGLVDALAERAGGSSLDAGQRIDISGLIAR